MKRPVRAKLAKLYFELAVLPGMDTRLVDVAATMCMTLIEHKKRIDISDLQLPWRPLHQMLDKELCESPRPGGGSAGTRADRSSPPPPFSQSRNTARPGRLTSPRRYST